MKRKRHLRKCAKANWECIRGKVKEDALPESILNIKEGKNNKRERRPVLKNHQLPQLFC